MEQQTSQTTLQDWGGSFQVGDGAVPGCCLHFPATKPDPIPAQPRQGHRRAGGSKQRSKHVAGNAGREKVRGKEGGHEMVGLQNTAVSRLEVPNGPYSYHDLNVK